MKRKMKEVLKEISPLFLLLMVFPFLSASHKLKTTTISPVSKKTLKSDSAKPVAVPFSLYNAMDLEDAGLSEPAFQLALKGFGKLLEQGKIENSSVLTVIDFSKPSTTQRLFVLSLDSLKVLYKTFVAHGRNSGTLYANRFSNRVNSHMSSLGFYTTGNTYSGEHGYSLKLVGEEKGINDNAARRAIVIHGAYYVTPAYANVKGYIGRSYGCPALPQKISRPIIETIKDGSCVFIYSPDGNYMKKSDLL
ncbi:MAG: murein L,D-transpeptidase catalytic domain family protein [Chitinophagaceae bacterium]|nr:murein L,D-transpeptidase catalytic domain family protein [Chitinophagaceae bacterium]